MPSLAEAAGGLLVAMLLVLLNGFFVAAEFSIVKVRGTQLASLVTRSPRARLATHITHHLDAYLAACQVGITLSSLGLGWLGEPAIASIIEPPLVAALGGLGQGFAHGLAFAVAFAFISFLHIVLGELAPKSLAIQRSVGTSLWVAWPLHIFYRVMYPFIHLLNAAGNATVRLIGLRPATESEFAHSPEELRLLVGAAGSAGVMERSEQQLVQNALDFGDRVVRHVMVPRTEIEAVPAGLSTADLVDFASSSPHARLPVYRGTLDEIVGVVHLRDLVDARTRHAGKTAEQLARPTALLPETMSLDGALAAFRQQRTDIGIVLDEFGGTAGLITVADIIEELVGEVPGEFGRRHSDFVEQQDGSTLVDGLTLVDDFRDRFRVDTGEDPYDTVGGLVLGRLGRLPRVGDRVTIGSVTLEVAALDGRRVSEVVVRPV